MLKYDASNLTSLMRSRVDMQGVTLVKSLSGFALVFLFFPQTKSLDQPTQAAGGGLPNGGLRRVAAVQGITVAGVLQH